MSLIFSGQDLVLLGYFSTLALLLVWAPSGPDRDAALPRVAWCWLGLVVGCGLARRPSVAPAWRSLFYKALLNVVIVEAYLMLRFVLPALRPDHVDGSLRSLDETLFGAVPALWMEPWSSSAVVEYFSFFYFSHYLLIGVYLLFVVYLGKTSRALAEFSSGITLLFCAGHLGYLMVPAYGPVRELAASFRGPLQGGFFWDWVQGTVSAGGAMKDVFPSLHTAVPTWLSLYAWRRASREPSWKPAAAATSFFAANILVSTLLLRWHYAVDVLAGLLLAVAVHGLSERWARSEETLRRSWALPDVWER